MTRLLTDLSPLHGIPPVVKRSSGLNAVPLLSVGSFNSARPCRVVSWVSILVGWAIVSLPVFQRDGLTVARARKSRMPELVNYDLPGVSVGQRIVQLTKVVARGADNRLHSVSLPGRKAC